MGHHNRQFYGDRHALDGAWSPPTSKANFCEEDYLISFYMAEFINSLTNLAYVYFALRYMYGGDPGSSTLTFSPKRVDFMSFSLLVLGVGSFSFHASMRQTFEFVDEIAMLFMSWSLLQGILTVKRKGRRAARTGNRRNTLVNLSLAAGFFLFSTFYVWTGHIIYHATAFALIILLIIARCCYLFYSEALSPEKTKAWRSRGRWALFYLALGYALWNVDLEFCAELRSLREWVGLPWAWLLELHGWWHMLTAVSADRFIVIVRELQDELQEKEWGKDQ